MSRLTSPLVQTLFLIALTGLIVGCQPSSESTDAGSDTATPSEPQPPETDLATQTSDAADAVPGEPGAPMQPPSSGEPALPAEPVVPAEPAEPAEPSTPEVTLAVGDPAPSLAIGKWFKGEPISAFADGQVYVVEFWATWCPPCRTSMPHISQLQDEYSEEVTFIGVTREDEETVSGFMSEVQNEETQQTWDDVVTYTIALDADAATGDAYMKAAGQGGIPTAFVVGKDGHVEWIGHPMQIDDPLQKVVAGEWDREKARTDFLAARAAEEAMKKLSQTFREAQQSGDWSVPLQMIDELLADQPDQMQLLRAKLRILLVAEKFDEAHVLADELAQKFQEDATVLNDIAWTLVTRVPPERQNTELSLQIAKQASTLRDDQDPSILDTVARVYYLKGNLEEAVAWQKKAVEAAPEGAADRLQQTLEQYESELTPAETEEVEEQTPAEEQPVEDSAEPVEEDSEPPAEQEAPDAPAEGTGADAEDPQA